MNSPSRWLAWYVAEAISASTRVKRSAPSTGLTQPTPPLHPKVSGGPQMPPAGDGRGHGILAFGPLRILRLCWVSHQPTSRPTSFAPHCPSSTSPTENPPASPNRGPHACTFLADWVQHTPRAKQHGHVRGWFANALGKLNPKQCGTKPSKRRFRTPPRSRNGCAGEPWCCEYGPSTLSFALTATNR